MGRKKKKQTEELEINEIVNENTNDNINNNINEDLYAPFGDKTFNKDELLDTNTSNENIDLNDSIEEHDAEIEKIKNDNEYLTNLDDSIIKEHIKQKKTPEEQNKFDLDLIKKYMGKKYGMFTKDKFNIYAFLFGGLYLMYRKIYFSGIFLYMFVILLISIFINNYIMLGIGLGIILLFQLFLGKIFNKMYLNRSYNQIKKIENIYNANKDEYVLVKCKQLGGTSIVGTIIISLIVGIIAVYLGIQINNFIK